MRSERDPTTGYKILRADESMLEEIVEFDRRISWELLEDSGKHGNYEEFQQLHRRIFMALYESPGDNVFFVVLDSDNKIVGLLWLKEEWDTVYYKRQAFIIDIEVDARHRRRGLGKRLLDEAAKYALSRGVNSMALRVELANKKAITFYRRYGFKPIAYIMERELERV